MSNENMPDEDFFIIDPDHLVERWSTFSRDYYRKACALADSRAEHERMKRQRDVIKAELDRDIRHNPEDYGLGQKTTEKAVENAVLIQRKCQQAEEDVIKAKHFMDIHQAFVDAMDAMKKGLEAYSYLWQASFFAEPKARGGSYSKMTDTKIERVLGARKNS